ncbi:hypothetical protein K431DRAFT_62692 [Polychaeton citri CBS 116435]|uniref:Uncharacterized protein n=1 Tax=Polychaeton citri CBS 116435 TaxID=1314669 RepID=A0A9P4Q7C5_9PEZI|nr:hypothetical protein K431DRAFT_62692 [Polychaeton citri CBS 116435]
MTSATTAATATRPLVDGEQQQTIPDQNAFRVARAVATLSGLHPTRGTLASPKGKVTRICCTTAQNLTRGSGSIYLPSRSFCTLLLGYGIAHSYSWDSRLGQASEDTFFFPTPASHGLASPSLEMRCIALLQSLQSEPATRSLLHRRSLTSASV